MRKLTRIEQVNADLLGDAALFHVTGTISNKSIQDCNVAIRDLLKRTGRRRAVTKESGLTV
jgi:hypothetical protein